MGAPHAFVSGTGGAGLETQPRACLLETPSKEHGAPETLIHLFDFLPSAMNNALTV